MKNTVKLILTAFLVLLGLCVCSGAVSADDLSYQYPQGLNPPQLGDVLITLPAPIPIYDPLPEPDVPEPPVNNPNPPVNPNPPGKPPTKTEGEIIMDELDDYLIEYCLSLGMTDDQTDFIYNLLYPIPVFTGAVVDVFHIPISVDDACDRLAVLISYIYTTHI